MASSVSRVQKEAELRPPHGGIHSNSRVSGVPALAGMLGWSRLFDVGTLCKVSALSVVLTLLPALALTHAVFAQALPETALSIDDVTVTEGDTGSTNATFTVTRSGDKTLISTVNFATANDTATQPSDYASASRTLTFNAGEATKTVIVPVEGDTTDETDEKFFVNLSTPLSAAIRDGQGVGTIIDDDDTPQASDDGSVANPITLNEDDPNGVTTTVTANDTGLGDAPTTVQLTASPVKGTATVNPDKTITYKPNANDNGHDTYRYTVTDSDGQISMATVHLQINPVNDAPSFKIGADQAVDQDSGAESISNFATDISKGPADEAGQNVNFVRTDNTDSPLFSIQPSISDNGTLTYTPAANAKGEATVSFKIKDDGGTANNGMDESQAQSFKITVNPVNNTPTITPNIDDKTILEDADTGDIPFTVGDAETAAGSLTVTASSSDTTLAPNDNASLILDGSGANRTIKVKPAANRFGGPARITLTANDGTVPGSRSATETFDVNVTPVNDAPSFDVPANAPPVSEDATVQTVSNFATNILAGPFETSQTVTKFQVTNNSNPSLFSAGPAMDPSNGHLTYTPATNAFGTANVTVRAIDDGGTANGGVDTSTGKTFTITVNPVNDAPVLDLNGDGNGVDYEAEYTEDEGPIGIVGSPSSGALSVRDVDDTNMESATVTLLNPLDGADEALLVNTSGTSITAEAYDSETGVLSLEGEASKAEYQDVLGTVKYDNASQRPTTVEDRFVEFAVNDGELDSAKPNTAVAVISTNDAPIANPGGLYDVNEGGSVSLNGTGGDPENGSLTYAWDLNNDGSFETPGQSPSFSAANIDGPAARAVVLRVTDSKGATATSNATVNIANVAPTATFIVPNSVNEGSDINLSLTDPIDPGGVDTFEFAFDCDLEDATGYGDFGFSDGASCLTADNGAHRVGAKIRDDDGGVSEYKANVTVNNVAPSVTNLSGSASVDEDKNGVETYSFSLTDPGNDAASSIVTSCGDNGEKLSETGTSVTCRFPDGPNTSIVSVKAIDSDGDTGDATTQSVNISNVKPSISLSGPDVSEEDDTKTYNYTVTDPGVDDHETTTTCGDNGEKVVDSDAYDPDTGEGSVQCYFPDGPTTARVGARVKDSDGASDSDNQFVEVTVADVAPTVDLSGPDTVSEGQTKIYNYTVDGLPADLADIDIAESCGAKSTLIDTPAANSFECRFPDGPAHSNVSVTVVDPTGHSGNDGVAVDIFNVAPGVSLTGPTVTDDGQTETYNYTITDLGDDPNPTAIEDCGANADHIDTPAPGSFRCIFAAGPSTSRVGVEADDGDDTGSDGFVVDVRNVAPTIDSVSPTGKKVSRKTAVTATFSEPMDESSVEAVGVVELKKGAKEVSARVDYDPATRAATLYPAKKLISGATYTATVTIGAKDLTATALAANEVWNFRVK